MSELVEDNAELTDSATKQMTFVDILTYRWTLISLNALSTLTFLVAIFVPPISASKTLGVLLVAAIPASGLIAFVTKIRKKKLLLVAGVLNSLFLILLAPFFFFGAIVASDSPESFGLKDAFMLLIVLIIPAMTVFACWRRRRHAV